MYWLFLFYLICVTDSIKGFSRCRGCSSILVIQELICIVPFWDSYSEPKGNSSQSTSKYFVVYLSCVYIYVRLVLSSYLLFCCICFVRCLVYHMLFVLLKQKNVSCEYDRWVVEAQLCKLREVFSDTLVFIFYFYFLDTHIGGI